MQPEEKQSRKTGSRLSLMIKCGAIFLLFLMSALIVACGAANSASVGMDGQQVTVTINFNNQTPVPTAPPYTCSAWVTQSTPGFTPGTQIAVNMKYVHNVNGNPVGVNGATAVATVHWADGYTDILATATTTSDGLAIAYLTVPNRPAILDKNNIVTVQFSSPDGKSCTVDTDRAAFFTFIAVTPTVTPSPSPTATPTPTTPQNPGVTPPGITFPTVQPTVGFPIVIPTPTVIP